MFVDFDKFGMVEKPVLTLCYPQGKELGQLGAYHALTYDVMLRSYSTISFKYPYYGENKVRSNLYDEIQNHMLIKAEGLGEFIITSCFRENSGTEKYINVTADSSEVQMRNRKINLFNGTYKFYDLLNPEDTLLGTIIKYLPTWRVGHISPELMTKYRTFDIPNSTLYDFLLNEVSQTYQCIFTFDTTNKEINAYTTEEITKNSDIFIGYGNFLKSEKIEEISDDLTTVLACYGGDGVNIASVNPLGSVFLYNFDHFKHMMSEDLQAALASWESRFNEEREEYAELLTRLKRVNTRLITAEANLKDAETELTSAEDIQSVQISGGRTETAEYRVTLNKIADAERLVAQYKTEIEAIKAEKAEIQNQQKDINNSLKFSTDGRIFSEENLDELEYFKYESTHQDDNFIITDVTDLVAQQNMIEQLYSECSKIMEDVAHPTYTITADTTNFLFIEKLAPFINNIYDPSKIETYKQLLGVKFHLEVKEDEWIEPVLLKFHVNFDDPLDFSMEFSNKYRLKDALWTYSDLVGDSVSNTGNMSFDYSSLKTWETHRNELVEFANSSLDATRNKLINNENNMTLLIDQTGLRGHSTRSDGTATGRGIWLTADTLAFSDDNFNTVKTAVGLIATPNGTYYGVNGEVLIGKVILGSELTIANSNNTLQMGANGLIVESANNRIWLNPNDGILIQKRIGNTYTNQMYADSSGNLVIEGNIKASSGSIGGFNITSTSISSPNRNIVLNSDGTGTIGMMTVGTNSTTFRGNIYANNIVYGGNAGYLDGGAIESGTITSFELGSGAVTSSKIDTGAITDAKIAGGTITTSSINKRNFRTYFDTIYADKAEFDNVKANYLTANSLRAKNITIGTDGGQLNLFGNMFISGDIWLGADIKGVNKQLTLKDSAGKIIMTATFSSGICTGFVTAYK